MLLVVHPSSFISRSIRPSSYYFHLPLIYTLSLLFTLHVLSCVFFPIHHHLRPLPMILVVLKVSYILAHISEYYLSLPMHLSIVEVSCVLGSRGE